MESSARAGGRMRYYCFKEVVPFSAMVSVECINMGLKTLYKAATQHGMNYHAYIVYIYSIAALVLLPAPFFSRRSTRLPPLTPRIMAKIGLLGLIGGASQIIGYTGINFSSPTLASAISNLVPAFTFILAIIFRMESAPLKSRSSRAKIIGTVVSISGAFIATLYQGPVIIFGSKQSLLLEQSLHSSISSWTLGGCLLIGDYFLCTLWYILQVQIMNEYPAEFTVIFYYDVCVIVVATIVGMIAEPNLNAWKVHGIGLSSVLCSGLFLSCLNNCVQSWALRVKGPLYVSMFTPLSIVIAVAMGVIFLGDTLHLGSLVGAMVISIGFYTVIWGKAKEEMAEDCGVGSSRPGIDYKVPLLQKYKADEV